MNWLNIPIGVVRAPEYAGSDPVERATWLNLLAYCAEQENGGRLPGARAWRDRLWQQACGVTLAEVDLVCALWRWEGDDLVVWGYPEEKEQEVRQKREASRTNGLRGGRPRKEPSAEAVAAAEGEVRDAGAPGPAGKTQRKPTWVSDGNLEEKGREENGKEGEGCAGGRGEAVTRGEPGRREGAPPCLDSGEVSVAEVPELEEIAVRERMEVSAIRGQSLREPWPEARGQKLQAQQPQQQQPVVFLKEARVAGRMGPVAGFPRPGAAVKGGGEVRPLQEVQGRLAAVWPAAPRGMTGMEMHDLHGSLSVLCELDEEDWTACAAWNAAPLRELGREKRWPRDRAEFVRHAGQAVELVRTWWKAGGRRWHAGKQRQGQGQGQGQRVPERMGAEGVATAEVVVGGSGSGDAGALAEFLAVKFLE